MSTSRYVTKAEAAVLCGRSEATIQRHGREGRLPSYRHAEDGTAEVAISDLVAAGLLDPTEDAEILLGRTQAERDLVDLRQQAAVAAERTAALEARLAAATDEITFLRSMLTREQVA